MSVLFIFSLINSLYVHGSLHHYHFNLLNFFLFYSFKFGTFWKDLYKCVINLHFRCKNFKSNGVFFEGEAASMSGIGPAMPIVFIVCQCWKTR